ncbi:MAG TPA: nuclear transport factor 2 family protein [Acidimicrobiales bacterium]|nr:nuclear transport factor 2 family protein [Acidimicrobiales bacterium]
MVEDSVSTEDLVALRRLVDRYASGVDHRDVPAVAALFSPGGRLVAHFGPGTVEDPVVRSGRDDVAAALEAGLARYRATTHVVGGQVVEPDGDGARGETTCLAHHLYDRDGQARLLVMAVRYADRYERRPGGWCFAERRLRLDWRQDRPLEER